MKFSLCLILLITVGACANRRIEKIEKTETPVAASSVPLAFDGNCGMGLCLKKKVKGDEKYGVDYKGKRYLFSSEKARDQFMANVDENISKANKQWTAMGAERAR